MLIAGVLALAWCLGCWVYALYESLKCELFGEFPLDFIAWIVTAPLWMLTYVPFWIRDAVGRVANV